MRGLLQLREHKVKSFHETLLVLLEHHNLVFVLLMSLRELSVVCELLSVFLNGSESFSEPTGFVLELVCSISVYTNVVLVRI